MTTFDSREKAAENKFAHDAELHFKAIARRNKLLGLWVAEKIGLKAAEIQDYSSALVEGHIATDTEALIQKVYADFAAHGVIISKEEIADQLVALETIATAEVMTKTK